MNKPITPAQAIEHAAKIIGSKAELARRLCITKSAVSQWSAPGRKVPLHHCLSIEWLTKQQVLAHQLRPDFEWLKNISQSEK